MPTDEDLPAIERLDHKVKAKLELSAMLVEKG